MAEITQTVQARLAELREAYVEGEPEAEEFLVAETRHLLESWQEAIAALGAAPKGIFTVDFRSPDPNVVWCWTVSEAQISHRHFTWESFKDRVEVSASGWPGRN